MNTNRTPVVLLDVDGVLNACTPNPDPGIWQDWRRGRALGFVIWWSPTVVNYLTDLHHSGRAEIRWHTTWQHDADAEIAPMLGLPRFAVAESPEYAAFAARSSATEADRIREGRARPVWWKYPAAERVVREEGRPLVWIDDDITYGLPRDFDPKTTFQEHAPALLVAPNERTGLTPKHLKRIDEFIAALAADPESETP